MSVDWGRKRGTKGETGDEGALPSTTPKFVAGRFDERDTKRAKIGKKEAFQFMQLPEDLRRNVMSFLPFLTITHLVSLNPTLKAWSDNDASLWTMLLQRNMPTLAGEPVSWNRPLEELTVGAIYSTIEPIDRRIPRIEGFMLPGDQLLSRASARNLALSWFFVRSNEFTSNPWIPVMNAAVTIVGPAETGRTPWVQLKSDWSMEVPELGLDSVIQSRTEIDVLNYYKLGPQFMKNFEIFIKSVLSDGGYIQNEDDHGGRDNDTFIALEFQSRKNRAAFFFALLTMGWGPNPLEDEDMHKLNIRGRI